MGTMHMGSRTAWGPAACVTLEIQTLEIQTLEIQLDAQAECKLGGMKRKSDLTSFHTKYTFAHQWEQAR